MACIEPRLETLVVGDARDGNLDHKLGFAGVELGKLPTIEDAKVMVYEVLP